MTQPHTMGIYAPATLMVRIHHGLVCQSAITACQLALRGITGPREQVLLGANGFLESARWETDQDALTHGLGEAWELTQITTKGYSACYFSHSAIDGIIGQIKQHGFTPADIEAIEIAVSTPSWRAVCEPVETKWDPQTIPECQFSLPYAVATAAYDGTVFVQSYSEEARQRGSVRSLMARISASEDPSIPDWGSRLTTTLRDGRVFASEHIYVKGHPRNPFSDDELMDKFRRCVPFSVLPLTDSVVDTMIEDVLTLETIDDVVQALLVPLTPSEASA